MLFLVNDHCVQINLSVTVSIWNNIISTINGELPEFQTLDEGIDYTMTHLGTYSKGLNDEYYVDNRWLEVRDDVNFQEHILHVFQEDGTYLRILEGDINSGTWEENVGGLIVKYADKHELYECIFLNEDFFILQKHGDQSIRGQRKYFFMVREGFGRGYDWSELLELMFKVYRSNMLYFIFLIFVVMAVVISLVFSFI